MANDDVSTTARSLTRIELTITRDGFYGKQLILEAHSIFLFIHSKRARMQLGHTDEFTQVQLFRE